MYLTENLNDSPLLSIEEEEWGHCFNSHKRMASSSFRRGEWVSLYYYSTKQVFVRVDEEDLRPPPRWVLASATVVGEFVLFPR